MTTDSSASSTYRLHIEDELSVATSPANVTRFEASYSRAETQPERATACGHGTGAGVKAYYWAAPGAEGSRTLQILHDGFQKPRHSGPGVLSYSGSSEVDVRGSMDRSFIQYPTPGLRSPSNDDSLHVSQPVPHGRVDRAAVVPADSQRASGAQHEPLGRDGSSNALLANSDGADIRVPVVNQAGPVRPPLTAPPPPPPPPPPPKPSAVRNSAKTIHEYATNPKYGSKTSDFDVDEIFKDIKFDAPQQAQRHPLPPVDTATNRPYSSSSLSPGTGTGTGAPPYTSPSAVGLAPPPTDQPIRNPVRYGVEGEVDALTIRMVNNMLTGEGAAGKHNCAKCGEGLSLMRPGCTALNQTYHLDCFLCGNCKKRLVGGSFYSVDETPLCENCYETTLDKCAVCRLNIKDRILKAGGKAYHPACFLCTSCGRCLDGVPFTVDANNSTHCVGCFHDKFAPRCAQCQRPIVPEEGKEETLRVVAMDRSYHIDCYRCEDCGMKLSSKVEGHECYPLDGHLLCKQCNGKRLRILTEAKVEYRPPE